MRGEEPEHDLDPTDSAAGVDVHALYLQHGRAVFGFLAGVLRDQDLAEEAFQNTFQKALEAGHTARSDSIQGWLFTVAYHEAMALRRRQATGQRVLKRYSEFRITGESQFAEPALGPELSLVQEEDRQRLQHAIAQLPTEQRIVVERRLHTEQTFAQIASELALPLGTILTRMRLATQKLREALR